MHLKLSIIIIKGTCYPLGKTAKISKLWTFWPVIQVINHLFKIRQKAGLLAELQARMSRSC